MARRLYSIDDTRPFPISRSKIELAIECPRCFYLDCVCGVKRVEMPPFSLNLAVDELLKREFDIHRVNATHHPLQTAYKIPLKPWQDERINEWRQNFVGIRYVDEETNLEVFGAVDDIWCDDDDKIYVVDYKATAQEYEIHEPYQIYPSYGRQVEIYQWLLRHHYHSVSSTAWFVFCNGKVNAPSFDGRIEFDIKLIPYEGDESWVHEVLRLCKRILNSPKIPAPEEKCAWCKYRKNVGDAIAKFF